MTGGRANQTGVTFGPLLIAVAAFFLYGAAQLKGAGLAKSDPGPQFWPVLLASCLLAVGIGYTLHALVSRLYPGKAERETGTGPDEKVATAAEQEEARRPFRWSALLSDAGLQNVLLLSATLTAYIAAIGWLGYAVSSITFATLMMTRLGQPAVAKALAARAGRRKRKTPAAWKAWLLTVLLAAVISTLLVVAIIVLFDRTLGKPLPHGDAVGIPV